MASRTRARVFALTGTRWVITLDTVAVVTLARRATSEIVFIKILARRPRRSRLGRKRRSFLPGLSILPIRVGVGIAVRSVERLTIAIMNALDGATRGFEIAGATGANGQTPDIGASLFTGGGHDCSHQISGTEAPHHTGGLWGFVGKSCPIGATHLPTMPTSCRDEQWGST